MVILSQLDQCQEMRGLITTLNKQGAMFVPVSAPIVYVQSSDIKDEHLGEIRPGHANYETYDKWLNITVTEGYAHMVQRPSNT